MALAVFLRGNKLPVLANAASKLMATKTLNSSLVLTPIVARNFTALNNRPALLEKKSILGSQIPQNRQMADHGKIWAAEKILSAALLGIIPVCVAFPHPILDNILAVSVVVHMHWGCEAVLCDYLRPSLVGHCIAQLTFIVVCLISVFTMTGLLYFNQNDIGLAEAVKAIWLYLGQEIVVEKKKGVESVVVDYVRPSLFHQNTIIPTIAHWFVYLMTAVALGGMIYFNYNDMGLAKAVRRIWQVKGV